MTTGGVAAPRSVGRSTRACLTPNHFHLLVETPKFELFDALAIGNRRYSRLGNLYTIERTRREVEDAQQPKTEDQQPVLPEAPNKSPRARPLEGVVRAKGLRRFHPGLHAASARLQAHQFRER
jgi:hypothetical protein